MRIAPAAALLAVLLLTATDAAAANYTLWIHGRNTSGSTTPGNYASFTAWGPSTTAAGVNKKAVNWDGRSRIADQNFRIRDALDCFCTGPNWCYVAAHSAGNLHIGYALALHGGTTRSIKNAVAGSNGVCGNAGGTQVGWNIKFVAVASGAGGGSELADIGEWAVSDPLTGDLKTGTARALYNHNTTRAKQFRMFAGAKGTLYSGVLKGQDDEAVSYHSTGGVAGASAGAFCNPSDWACNDLTTGTAACEGGFAKWSYHTVSFRDDTEAYDHHARGQWLGIVGRVRSHMVTYAY
jgi:hypothetical protein